MAEVEARADLPEAGRLEAALAEPGPCGSRRSPVVRRTRRSWWLAVALAGLVEEDPVADVPPAANAIIDPADGKVPYTAAARAKSDDLIANGMYHEPELHCFMSSVPHNMWVQFGQQTIQTKDYVVFNWEFMHSRRIIPLDNRPHQITSPAVKLFQGESVGHWEGDTLVVDTTNQNDKTWFDTSGHYKPEDVHVVERFTMTDSNTIEYEADITSAEFTQPMKVKGRQTRANANDPNYEQMEFACIEGNQDVKHYTEDKGGKAKNVGARTQ